MVYPFTHLFEFMAHPFEWTVADLVQLARSFKTLR